MTPPTAAPSSSPSSTPLERIYDGLALGIDRAGAERSELFLVKLCLLLADALGDDARVAALCERALDDL